MSHESWVINLCIFHKVMDVLLIKMSLSHLFDGSSKARKVSLFCISSDPTSVCQSLGVSFNVPDVATDVNLTPGFGTWQTRLLPRFWLGTGKSKQSFHLCFPHFQSRMERGGQTKNALRLTRNNSRVWGGDDVSRKKHYSISNILSGIHVFISWCFITHPKQFPAISRLFIQIKIF